MLLMQFDNYRLLSHRRLRATDSISRIEITQAGTSYRAIEFHTFTVPLPNRRERRAHSPKMVQRHHVQGYENFLKYMEDLKAATATPTYVLYTGTKLPDTGESWCPDCVEGERIFCLYRHNLTLECSRVLSRIARSYRILQNVCYINLIGRILAEI